MPVDIDVINKQVIGSFFLLGMLVGGAIAVFVTDFFKSKRRE